jgi:hypothetical protein
MLNKKAVIGILIVFGVLIISAYKLPFTGKLEATSEFEKSGLSGEILSIKYEPDRPKILEKLSITVDVKNNGNEKNNYLLELKITKNGQTKFEEEFTFSLMPDQNLLFTPSFNPEDTGEHNIVLRLYDKNKLKLYDEKILILVIQSDVGPFDLEVDLPSHTIGLGDSLPATVSIANMGEHGTDVNLNLDLRCTSGKDISKDIYIFVNSSSEIKRQIFVDTCAEVGQNTLIVSLSLYGKELLSSKNQFYVSSEMPEIQMSNQHWLKINSGEKTNFGIEVTNPGNINLINVKPFVFGVPSDWVYIEPSSYNVLKPNETIIFMATIHAPDYSETKSYEIRVGVGGDNVFSKNEAILSVTGVAATTLINNIPLYQLLSSYWSQIALVAVVVVLIFLFFKWKGRKKKLVVKEEKAAVKEEKGIMKGLDEEFEKLKKKWKNKKSEQAKK